MKAVAVHSSEVSPRQQEIGLRFIIEDCGVGGVMYFSEYYKQRLNVDQVDPAVVGQPDFHRTDRRITREHAKRSQKTNRLKSGSRVRGKSS
jgi:hypothetical protein